MQDYKKTADFLNKNEKALHMIQGLKDVLKAWEVLQNRIVHVHCKDRGKEPLAVGKGYIPMKAVINKIKESGYQGYLAIEHFDAKNQEACIEASAKYLREIVATV